MEARNWSRHIVEKDVACLVEGAREQVFLYDLSMGGCMFEMACDRDMRERSATLDLQGQGIVQGQVVWQVGRCIGMRFEALIPQAVVRRLGFTPPVEDFLGRPVREPSGHAPQPPL
ncbi:hypothetical protein NRB_24630 [Novosphingobium sp. 11B]|uniref:PilZ domain-containing protein n=1 Tax=Novosphingobium resinovorum TaxID=158500 RepID=A0A1D8A4D8_9SPHN|nr:MULTISPECIES: PilZ domain-containing protein [Sphingomonadaceae]AOR76968.1 hypothetical protein BES08_09565 [Novosphingobium resinovorum]EJU12454.1 hypothetical protein LH128_13588 [Sphingomonas sp. LH128]